jgi:hypothetical protein
VVERVLLSSHTVTQRAARVLLVLPLACAADAGTLH